MFWTLVLLLHWEWYLFFFLFKEFHNDAFGCLHGFKVVHNEHKSPSQDKPRNEPSAYFFPRRESTLGTEGAEAKIEKNVQLHYPRPPSIKHNILHYPFLGHIIFLLHLHFTFSLFVYITWTCVTE